MAKDKSSFILYTDLLATVSKLTDKKAGLLFKTILKYVNDLNPEVTDPLIDIAFEPIKQQLKRDLKKWDRYIDKQSENGKLGGRPKKAKETQKTQAFLNKPKKADSVSVTVSDSVIDTVSKYIKPDENFQLDLPEQKINSAIQYLMITKNVKANREMVLSLWTFFKEKNFTGENPYKSKSKIFTHFFESLKFENINGQHSTSAVGKTIEFDKP